MLPLLPLLHMLAATITAVAAASHVRKYMELLSKHKASYSRVQAAVQVGRCCYLSYCCTCKIKVRHRRTPVPVSTGLHPSFTEEGLVTPLAPATHAEAIERDSRPKGKGQLNLTHTRNPGEGPTQTKERSPYKVTSSAFTG
ncbi:uncharacterized protein LOC122078649 [Macadamia integrifolia]|uniref:uncharacterized protein LOC122078649 n=1 Tax=Macadamia integrifolia TaxID=60698 RepID=UPI001C4FB904|nr:uncharacterized protein LOC122078649 [Macadamia integrifolia]